MYTPNQITSLIMGKGTALSNGKQTMFVYSCDYIYAISKANSIDMSNCVNMATFVEGQFFDAVFPKYKASQSYYYKEGE